MGVYGVPFSATHRAESPPLSQELTLSSDALNSVCLRLFSLLSKTGRPASPQPNIFLLTIATSETNEQHASVFILKILCRGRLGWGEKERRVIWMIGTQVMRFGLDLNPFCV